MSVTAKLAGFAAVLLGVFAVGFGIGAATAPEPDAPGTPATEEPTATTMPSMDMGHGAEHGS
ncbi:MAG TPA: hypothetical protein PKA98_07125 [Acidimicrobiales bacterium]|nr:hypothetical protein [Acidimicrobiales bacterium]